jgi:hypothetical protein
MSDSFYEIINGLQKQIDQLARRQTINVVAIPAGGKLVVDTLTADPAVEDGRIYYNSTTGKLRGCQAGVWANLI